MKRSKEKSVNRKALPKFFGLIALSMLIGGIVGFLMAAAGDSALPDHILHGLNRALDVVTPWGIPVSTALLAELALRLYGRAKAAFKAWDGEDEAVMDAAEEKLSWAILLSSINLLLDFFFMSAAFQERNWSQRGLMSMVVTGCFILSIALLVLMQQKVVDLTRAMNPEKKASVYDMGFQKKWYDSCDESERQQIGEASYRAFLSAGNTCLYLWVGLFLLSGVFDIGLLPSTLMLVVWGVLQVSYILACIRRNQRSAQR